MSHTAKLQMVNLTNSKFTCADTSDYQMNTWAFNDIPMLDYNNTPVDFYSGHYDEDDGASAYYVIDDNSGFKFTIQGRSNNDSGHYLQVVSESTNYDYVIVTNTQGPIISPANAHDLNWSPCSTNAVYRIGYMNDAVL